MFFPNNFLVRKWRSRREFLALTGLLIPLCTFPASAATGDLEWYQHLGRSDGTVKWSNSGTAIKVGSGWNFQEVFPAGNGVIYGIASTGDLLWYRHVGRSDGTIKWANSGSPIKVGTGWNSFKQVFAADDGVIYAITQSGDLLWYQHLGQSNGAVSWANSGSPIKVGSGWNGFKQVFAADDGVIYAITQGGDLLWYQHLGRSDGTVKWANSGSPIKVGNGWLFDHVFAANDGVIYAVTSTGDLLWYRHQGRSDGTVNWAYPGGGIKVGSGWHFRQVFAAEDGVIYAIF
jgi:predicted lipoprotein with Yx(FWY)xxD motif